MVSKRCLQVPFNAFFVFVFFCCFALKKYIYKRIPLRSGNSLEYGIQGSANIFSAYFNFPNPIMVSKRCLHVPFNAFYFWICLLDCAGKVYLQTHLTGDRKFPGIWHS